MAKKRKLKKESFMQGVLVLMVSQVFIKILGLVYNLYLTNRSGFGDEGNAIYSSGFQIYALLLTLSSVGVPNAISKLVSERLAKGDGKGAHRIFKIAFVTFAVIGLVGTLILFFGAHFIATSCLEIPEAEMTLVSLSPSIFFVAISSVLRGYFNGRENMTATAKAQTLEQVFKAVLTIVFVEMIAVASKTNTILMAAGANLSTTFATFLSFAYLFKYYKETRDDISVAIIKSIPQKQENIKCVIKKILAVSIPISLSALLSAINKNIDSFTVVRYLKAFLPEEVAKIQYGILSGKVDTLTSLPLSFNIALATALVPAISAARAKGEKEVEIKRISFSLLVTILLGIPCTIGMCVFAGPILNLLFPNASSGALLLQISSFTIIFTVLAQTINGALQGLGRVAIPAIALSCGVVVKLILNIVLIPIPSIGVNGAAIGSVVCHIISFIIGLVVLKKTTQIKLGIGKFLIKPLLAGIMMGICSYFIYTKLLWILSARVATLLAIILAVIIYGLALLALKILSKEEIYMIPYGQKVYKVLVKLGIYRDSANPVE